MSTTVTSDESHLSDPLTTQLKLTIGTFASIGLVLGLTVFWIGQQQGGLALTALGQLLTGIIPFGGPIVATLLGLIVELEDTPSPDRPLATMFVAGALGYVVMFGVIMLFMMVQPTQSTSMPRMLVATSLLKAAIPAGIGAALGSGLAGGVR